MKKKIVTFLFAICLAVGLIGCTLSTTGSASWEVYTGIRHQQISEEPAKVAIESSIVDKIVDLFTKPDQTEDE